MLMRNGKKIGSFYSYDKEKNTYILREPKEGELFDEKKIFTIMILRFLIIFPV